VTARRRVAVGVAPLLVVAVLAGLTVAALAVRPAADAAGRSASHVVIAGAPGLRWSDLDPDRTPHLWQLAGSGAIANLSVRSTRNPTCEADGWLTLGAGNWAGDTTAPASGPCRPLSVEIEPSGAAGAYLPGQEELVRDNRWQLPWGAVPGALAGAVECTAAVGEGGAVAAARVYGRVDRYVPRLPRDPEVLRDLLGRCELSIVDLGVVAGEGAARRATAARVDEAVGRLLAARAPRALLLVAGLADTDEERRLRVVIGDGPHLDGGWLTSRTTGRTGYLQLVDVTATALAALGRPAPQVRLIGHPAERIPDRDGPVASDVARLVAADEQAGIAAPARTGFLAGWTVAYLLLLAAMVPLLRAYTRRRVGWDGAARHPPAGTAGRAWAALPVVLVAAALVGPAALLAGGLPWWRAGPGAAVFGLSLVALVAAGTAMLVGAALYRGSLVVVGGCAALAAAVVGADLLAGSGWQLDGVLGYSAHDGDRYAGLGPVAAGLLMAGVLLTAGSLAQRAGRRWRAVVVVAVGAVGVVVTGSPYLGADTGAAMALTAGVCLAAVLSTGGWFTLTRLAWAALAGFAVTVGLALTELPRPVDQRAGLGRLVTELGDGTLGFSLQRVSLANWESLTASPLNLVAVGSGLFAWLVLLRPSGGLRRVFGINPALRAGMVGTVVAAVAGGVVTGAALTVAGAAATVVVPLAALASSSPAASPPPSARA
jgi:hypothetical protein